MGCDQTEKISLLIDGELATEDARSLELHLSTCSQCNQVRADFLGLRSQISAYALSGEPSRELRPALAKVLSKSHTKPAQAGWRPRFLGLGDALAFNTRFAAVAALILLTLTIGTIAFLRYRPQRELATNNPPLPSSVSQSSGTTETVDQLAKNSGRKSPRGQPRETGPPGRKPNSRIKPARERSAPKPLPQLQNAAPPNYAFLNGPNGANDAASIRSADTEAASHFEQSELLLRAFRNLRPTAGGRTPEIAYERRRAQQLLYRNIMLRREADSDGDVQVATLLGSLEPILLDIANLRDKPRNSEVQTIKERVERTSLVALLQVNSMAVARAND